MSPKTMLIVAGIALIAVAVATRVPTVRTILIPTALTPAAATEVVELGVAT